MMLAAEYDRMAAVEETHWWYRGVRDLLARLLRQAQLPPDAHVLDAGCGTGANLLLLQTELHPKYLGGFDASEQAVASARAKVPDADVYGGDLRAPEIHLPRLDAVLCVDVIYMTGLDAALPGLRTLVSHLPAGGLFLLHVPAYDWLYSRHDVAVGTRQRFTVRQIRSLLEQLGLTCERLTYRMCLLFPLIVLSRLPSLLFGAAGRNAAAAESDLVLPPQWLNACLTSIVRFENRLIALGIRFPFGSSIIALGRKP